MEHIRIEKLFLTCLTVIVISSCSTSNPYDSYNKNYIKAKQPVRLVKEESYSINGGTKYSESWAGIKGKSAIGTIGVRVKLKNHLKE